MKTMDTMVADRADGRVGSYLLVAALLIGLLVLAGAAPLRAQGDPDLPGRTQNIVNIPQGSLVIPNALCTAASGGTCAYQTGGTTVYGAVVHLLHAGIPVRWAVTTGKASKQAVDFSASMTRIYPNAVTGTVRHVAAGAWVVDENRKADALAVLLAFRTNATVLGQNNAAANLEVFELDAVANLDIMYALAFKPKVGVLTNGSTGIHEPLMRNAGMILNTHYINTIFDPAQNKVVPLKAEFVTDETCVTMLTEPHASVGVQQAQGILSFLNGGGNFQAQCEAVPTYETAFRSILGTGLLSSGGNAIDNGQAPPYTYPHPDLAFSQFLGDLPSEGGSWGGGQFVGTYVNSGHEHAHKPGPVGQNNYVELLAGKYTSVSQPDGQMVFYHGGHNWGTGATNAGQRAYLNAVLVPAWRPVICGLGITLVPEVIKTGHLVADLDDSGSITAGDIVEFTITVTNPNDPAVTQPLTNTVLVDNIPANTTYVAGSTTVGGTPVADGGGATPFPLDEGGYQLTGSGMQPGEMASGQTIVITFRVKIDDPMPVGVHAIVNTATVYSDFGPGEDTEEVPVDGVPDLSIIKTSTVDPEPKPVAPGDVITYSVTVTNEGQTTHTGVTMTDVVPEGTTYVPGSALYAAPVPEADNFLDQFNAIAYTNNDGSLNWTGSWVEIGEATSPTGNDIRVVADAAAGSGYVLSVKGKQERWVYREANLSGYTKATLKFRYRRVDTNSDAARIQVEISNDGGSTWFTVDAIGGAATDATYQPASYDVSAYIASNTRIRFGSYTQHDRFVYFDDIEIAVSKNDPVQFSASYDGGSKTVSASGITLEPGESTTLVFKVTVNVPPPIVNPIVNTAFFSSDDDEACPTGVTPVRPQLCKSTIEDDLAPFSIVKTATIINDGKTLGKADPGETIEYTVQVWNLSDGSLTNVVLVDNVPANTTYVLGSASVPDDVINTPFPLDEAGYVIGTMSAGTSFTVTFRVTVNKPFPGGVESVTNVATATSNEIPEAKKAEVTTPVAGSVLGITKSSDATGPVSPGQVLTYTIVVTNASSETQTNVTVTDAVPVGTTSVPGSTLITAPGLIDTYADDFDNLTNTPAYNGSDGTLDWSTTPWVEIGDDNTPGGGDIRVISDLGSLVLQIDSKDRGAYRPVDLSAYTSATFEFKYRRAETGAGKFVRAQISGDGGATWTTLLTLELTTTDAAYVPVSFNISAGFLTANARIRFFNGSKLQGDANDNDKKTYFDDVKITASKSAVPGGDPPNLASGFTLAPSQSLIVTFQVTVEEVENQISIDNEAFVTSTQDPDGNSAIRIDPIDLTGRGSIGAAKVVSEGPDDLGNGEWLVKMTIFVKNTGTVTLSNVQVLEDLSATFTTVPPTTWSVVSVTSSGLTVNPGFNGASDISLLAGTDVLAPGVQKTVDVTVKIDPFGTTLYFNQVLASGKMPDGNTVEDLSTDGIDVDPDKDGDPTNNSNPTPISIKEPTLGVELARFEATPKDRTVNLVWETSSETSNAGFAIERAFEEDAFEEVAFVPGAGTTTEAKSYSLALHQADFGRLRVRLRQINLDGAATYSPEIEVFVEMPDAYVLDPVYPNPFNPQATVAFAVREAVPVKVELYSVLGQMVQLLYEGTPEAGRMQSVRVNGHTLTSGLYFVRLMGDGYMTARSVVLLK